SAVSNLPSSNPSTGSWYVSDSELRALGLQADIPPGTTDDGYIGLSTGQPFTYDLNNRAVSGKYDAIGTLEHEISEDMGRVANYGASNFSPLDLFRYTSPGTIATIGNTAAYFSVDGGNTSLDSFNNSGNRGDAGDWANSVPNDSYDAFANISVANTVSPTDLTLMNVLGYALAAACYAAGTRILIAQGEVRVEDL